MRGDQARGVEAEWKMLGGDTFTPAVSGTGEINRRGDVAMIRLS